MSHKTPLVRTHEQYDIFEREIILPNTSYLFNFAFRRTRKYQTAEDLVQETFLNAWRFYDGFRHENARAWLSQILMNNIRGYYKKSGLPLELLDHERMSTIPEPEDLETTILQEVMHEEVTNTIKPEYRHPLVLLNRGLSDSEIAAEMGISVGAAKTRIHRARRLLKERIHNTNLTELI